ncbi:MAG TPA: hypothetical protein VM510_13100, partial [Caulifigura sp.]|nr:hypothetical protein [Caulifigura sp.]
DELLAHASVADRFDPDPWRRRSQFAFQQWSQTQSDDWFQKSIEYQRQAIARDPIHSHDHRTLANLYLQRFSTDRRGADAEAAVVAAKKSLELYPNQVAGRRILAEALAADGKAGEAKAAAQSTLDLNDLWVKLGHLDKVMTAGELDRMKTLAGSK